MSRSSREQVSALLDVLRTGLDWLLEGIGIVIPRAWSERGWRPEMRIKQEGKEDLIEERSFFRIARSRRYHGEQTEKVRIILPGSLHYRSQLTLPIRAAARLEETLKLRLAELSPIPPQGASIAYRVSGRTSDRRIVVDFSIARTEVLDSLIAQEFARIVEIVAEPGAEDRLAVFRRRVLPRPLSSYRPAVPWMALAASLVLLLVTVDARLDRRASELHTRADGLIHEIKALDRESLRLKAVVQIASTASRYPTPSALLAGISRLGAELPVDVVLAEVSLSGAGLHAVGFAPNTTKIQLARASLTTSTTLRPGFQRVDIDLALGDAQ